MKSIKYLIMAACCFLATACMNDNDDWNTPSHSESSFGNNALDESKYVDIKTFIDAHQQVAFSSGLMEKITDDVQIKGRVTGNDVGGNFYKKITIQDNPANAANVRAITICIDESGLWGYLPLGTEILINLKDLYIGGSGQAPQIGVPYVSKSGSLGIGRMPKALWHQHFKILNSSNKEVEPLEFTSDVAKNMNDNAGKLVIFKNVTFKTADGVKTFKDGPESNLKGYFQTWLNEWGSNVVFYTSGDYAKFSSMILPYDKEAGKAIPCDVIGIASRYGDTWQISIRQTSDIKVPAEKPQPTSDILNVSFASGQGDFTIDNKELGSLSYVWNADSKGYMKANAFVSSKNNASESWLVSPAFSLKDAASPVLTFNNACNYIKGGTITDHIKVMVYDGVNWAETTIANMPDGASWNFVDSTVDLKAYAGKEGVKIAFKYVSTTDVAPTWEIKSVTVK